MFKLFWEIFSGILMLEMGDKTQIAGFAFATKHGFVVTFCASAAALTVSSALAVGLGGLIGKFFPERTMELLSALLFLGFGAWGLYRFFYPNA